MCRQVNGALLHSTPMRLLAKQQSHRPLLLVPGKQDGRPDVELQLMPCFCMLAVCNQQHIGGSTMASFKAAYLATRHPAPWADQATAVPAAAAAPPAGWLRRRVTSLAVC